MVRKIVLSFVAVLGVVAAAMSQNRQVSGSVTGVDGQPIIGATVLVDGTSTGMTTTAEGTFSVAAPANGTLVISFVGYKAQQIAINGKTRIDVVLEEDTTVMDEVTVVAFGTKRKQDLVGSVSSVKQNLIQNAQSASISDALEGAVAGLQVFNSTGQPGTDASIIIRGIGSLSASNGALIVVDGVPFNGRLSDINPTDIKSITVSKDAVSNSLYGSRAANGVVMVTTKTGQRDRMSIQFQGSWGVSQRAYKDYDMVTDQGEFYRMTWYGLRNTAMMGNPAGGLDPMSAADASAYASQRLLGSLGNYNAFIIPQGEYLVGTDGQLNPNARLRYDDSFADAMFKNSFRQEYNVSASGGNERTDYYVSMGYLDNDSYIVGSSYERMTTRANINSQLKRWLKVGMNVAYSKATRKGVNESSGTASNPFATARGWAPIFPVHAYDADGNMKYDEHGKPIWDAGTGQTDGTTERPTATNQNVIANLHEDIRKTEYHNLNSRAYVEIKFLKDFTFSANYSYDYTNAASTTYYTPTIGDGQSFGGRGTKNSGNDMTSNFNQILSYQKEAGDHHIAAKIGHEFFKYKGTDFEGQKTNFFDPTNPELNNGGALQHITSYEVNHNIEGYFAMADYDFGHKYYLSAAYRRDGTSRFLDRWGNFWSVGAAWRISQEEFMKGASSWLDDLKLRASYGTQGNESILAGYAYGYTPYQDQYEVTWDGKQLGYSPVFYGNPDLTWEKQKTWDVGVDFRLWNRVYGSVEYFYRKTDDMLFRKTLSTSAGRPYNWENLGAMSNQGVEFELNVDVMNRKDLKWTVTLVGSHYANRILTLPEENREEGIVTGTFKYMEGQNLYEYYTYAYAGMNESGAPTWYTDVLDEAGNVVGRETTDNYTKATKYYLGKSAIPDFTGGLSMSLQWKGLDLSVATAFQIGGYAYDSQYLSGMSSSFYVGHHKDMWKTFDPVTGQGSLPVWNANSTSNSYTQTSDAHLISASYFSLRNVTLGYSLPKRWMSKLGIGSLRIFVTADNVALASARRGFDPRTSLSGGNGSFSGYSPMRIVSGGVNLTF
ncbi:TonB-dependent receptor [uncultured Alistipes sp.]|uniref:SusC/RagA family TonB-linked outer membrane protein n=1 Tax=uncultured Alistipes sp. TaxID=538949 RepID=UPI002628EA32|nr:TonB-dependent receptor [uncultured Alistipes sp.]